jgi:predicted nucleic acid-binding protein
MSALFLDGLVSAAVPVRLSFRWRPVLGDPADDMVLETAINGSADLLVTFNQRHFAGVDQHFQLRVVSPAEALEHLER